jgi:hypothetical protein
VAVYRDSTGREYVRRGPIRRLIGGIASFIGWTILVLIALVVLLIVLLVIVL